MYLVKQKYSAVQVFFMPAYRTFTWSYRISICFMCLQISILNGKFQIRSQTSNTRTTQKIFIRYYDQSMLFSGSRKAQSKNIYPNDRIANLNRSPQIQVFTICFISSVECPAPPLAMIASLIGNMVIKERRSPAARVSKVIDK